MLPVYQLALLAPITILPPWRTAEARGLTCFRYPAFNNLPCFLGPSVLPSLTRSLSRKGCPRQPCHPLTLLRRGTASMMSHGGDAGGEGGQQPKPNHLINEKSPYLRHHAHNPVDWYPWGEDAFKKARETQRVIMASSGYSACHWCLVMARESFESQRIAQLLNDHFVCIKVDREERPDVDAMLIKFIEQSTGSAGWPLNVFLTPDLRPFTGGTYFPEPRFATVLERIRDAWENNRQEVQGQADRVVQVFRKQLAAEASSSSLLSLTSTEAEGGGGGSNEAVVNGLIDQVRTKAMDHLSEEFDTKEGGFGRSLKFPRPSCLNFLFRAHYVDGGRGGEALHMATTTLLKMAQGGIRDHIGGGFHRYSTDPRWHVPHFEKMIYDQAQLITSYVEAFEVTGDQVMEEVARDTIQYVMRDMMSQDGGFYSAESAESPPPATSEGAFYVWTKEEVVQAFGDEDEAERFCSLLGIKEGGNVMEGADPHGELTGQNVLFLTKALGEVTKEDREVLRKGREALMAIRDKRPRPERDEKVVAGWNGMMIGSLSRAFMGLQDSTYLDAARKTANHIRQTLYDEQTGVLMRLSFQGSPSNVPAVADDYASMIRGLMDLYEASGEADYLRWAKRLQGKMDERFLCRGGEEGEGYLQSRRDDPAIAYLVKSTYDGAEPSATSVAVHNLLRLAAITDDDKLYKQAERIIAAVLQDPAAPYASPELLSAVLLYGDSLREIIITGRPGSSDTRGLLEVVHRRFLPDSVLITRSDQQDASATSEQDDLSLYSPTVRLCGLVQGEAAARTCQARVCSPPLLDPQALAERLAMPSRRRRVR